MAINSNIGASVDIGSQRKRGMMGSIYEGSSYNIWWSAVSSNFLTGFALYLGAGGFTLGLLGSLAAFSTMMQLVTAPMASRLTGGRRWWLMAMSALQRPVLALAGLAALFLVPSHWALGLYVVVQIFSWIVQAPLVLLWNLYMTDLVPISIRGRYLSKRSALTQVAAVLAVLAYGVILDRWPGATGFRYIYLFALLGSLMNLSAWLFHPELPRSDKPAQRSFWAAIQAPLTTAGRQRPLALFLAIWAFTQNLAVPFYSVKLVQNLGLSYEAVSMLAIVASVTMILTSTFWGRLQDRIGETRSLTILSAILAVVPLLFLTGRIGGWPALVLAHMLWGSANNGFNLANQTLQMRLAPNEDRGSYYAFFAGASGITGFLTPLLVGPLTGRYIDLLFVASAILSIGLTILWRAKLEALVRPPIPEVTFIGTEG